MNKLELIQALKDSQNLSKTEAIKCVETFFGEMAKAIIKNRFNSKQQVFLDFVLSHYVSVGVEELGTLKLTPLLRLKYHDSIADALADLGPAMEINKVFVGFQQYLYREQVLA